MDNTKGTAAALEESVAKVLELQSKYGMDQETMLIYMCSVNLTGILSLIGKRYHGSSSGYLQAPVAASPAVVEAAPVGTAATGTPPHDPAGMLNSLLGGQSGSGGQGFNPAVLMNLLGNLGGKEGQGLTPAMLSGLLSALGGQNLDLSHLMHTLTGLMGTGAKTAAGPGSTKEQFAATKAASGAAGAAKGPVTAGNEPVMEKQAGREVPKIMKWDRLDDRKKANK